MLARLPMIAAGIVHGTSELARFACALSYAISLVLIAESVASLVISRRIVSEQTPPILDGDEHVNHLREQVYRLTRADERLGQLSSIALIVGGVILIAIMLQFGSDDDPEILLATLGAIVGVVIATRRLVTTARARTSQQTMRKEQHHASSEHRESA